MTIDWPHFTPWASLAGGLLAPRRDDIAWRLAFVAGLFVAPLIMGIAGQNIVPRIEAGVGWGLGGFCPGPALVSLGSGVDKAAVFVAAMLVGMLAYTALGRLARRPAGSAT